MKKVNLIILSLILFASTVSKANIVTLTIDSITQAIQIIEVSSCDTIEVINNSNYSDYFSGDTIAGGVGDFSLLLQPDSIIGEWGQEVSYFFDLSELSQLVIFHQMNPIYFYVNIVNCLPSSVIEPLTESINVFPNPAQSRFYIETLLDNVSLTIFSSNGARISSMAINNRMTVVEIDQFESGLYLLKITSDQGFSIFRKIYKIS